MKRLALCFALVLSAVVIAEPVSAATTVSVNGIQKNIQLLRQSTSRPMWRRSVRLDQAAAIRAAALIKAARLNHGTASTTAAAAIRRVGYSARSSGELLAADFLTSRDTVLAWQNSAPHRAILMSRTFRDFGIAVVHTPPGSPFKVITVVIAAQKSGL